MLYLHCLKFGLDSIDNGILMPHGPVFIFKASVVETSLLWFAILGYEFVSELWETMLADKVIPSKVISISMIR